MSEDEKNTVSNQPAAPLTDPLVFIKAMMDVYDKARPVFEKNIEKSLQEDMFSRNFDPLDINPVYTQFIENLFSNPDQFWQMQSDYWTQWYDIWRNTTLRFLGDEDTAPSPFAPEKGDRRFKDEDWQNNALFDFMKQSYLMTCKWVDNNIQNAQGLDQDDKNRLAFTAKLYANALSPSNFALTNPEVLRETINTGGQNLIKGFENLVKDMERGNGELQISTTRYDAFEVGKNLAVTKGSVVYQNKLMQLIQYAPTTKKVHKRPMLVIPPWINKYYILDMRPDNSFIKWACDQGHTVFCVSWVNPTLEHKDIGFEDYMQLGILESINEIENITGESSINAVGYCLGGTLLSMTLAYLHAKKLEKCVHSATFLTTLLDFEHAGDLKMFLDSRQVEAIEHQLEHTGIFEAKILQQTFKLLRSNDLIWSFVVNNYLMGKEPFPFDLLYWNDDSTNMPGNMQRFYLKNMYRDNLLAKPNGIKIADVDVDLSTIKTPSYFLSTKEDHIAPWQATYRGPHLLGGKTSFVLAASGHIAGVVNPPAKEKYCYWTNKDLPEAPQDWLDSASQSPGSWWPHWGKWVKAHGGDKVDARKPAKGIEPAPGSYVKKR